MEAGMDKGGLPAEEQGMLLSVSTSSGHKFSQRTAGRPELQDRFTATLGIGKHIDPCN